MHPKPVPADVSATATDYHVHCHLDGCAEPGMTLSALYAEAVRAGLHEICVVKHYSHTLPNGEDAWVFWKRTSPADLHAFLDEFRSTPQPSGLRVLCGVETELTHASGDLNIPEDAAARLDVILVSNHWIPEAPGLPRAWASLMNTARLPAQMNPDELGPWMKAIEESGPEPYVKAVCEGNAAAVRRHPKARVLAHLGDGMHILRTFRVPVDSIPDERLVMLATPVIDACIRHRALWELTPDPPVRHVVVREANRRGVRFTGTVDAHFLSDPRWGHSIRQHSLVEDTIRSLGLRRGRLELATGE